MPDSGDLSSTESGTMADARSSALVPAARFEAQLRAWCARGRFSSAAWSILRRYGVEIRSFLAGRTRSRASLDEVYAVFSEDVWKGLPKYRSSGQVRAWLFSIARHALARHVRRGRRWRSVHVPVDASDFETMPAPGRRSLPPGLSDRARLQRLLARLGDADRQLLEQRLLQALPWREIALEQIAAPAASQAEIERISARLRKRYQLLVRSLRQGASLSDSHV